MSNRLTVGILQFHVQNQSERKVIFYVKNTSLEDYFIFCISWQCATFKQNMETWN